MDGGASSNQSRKRVPEAFSKLWQLIQKFPCGCEINEKEHDAIQGIMLSQVFH